MAVIQVDLGRVTGEQGPPGQAATIRIGKVTAGDTPQVINTGSPTNAVLNFVLPTGQPAAVSTECVEIDAAPRLDRQEQPAEYQETKVDEAGTLVHPRRELYVQSLRQPEGLFEECDTEGLDEKEVRLLACFCPVKGMGRDGKLHYGFLTGQAERAMRELGHEPEHFGVLGCDEMQGRAYRWLALEELLALAVGGIQGLEKRVKQLEEGGR